MAIQVPTSYIVSCDYHGDKCKTKPETVPNGETPKTIILNMPYIKSIVEERTNTDGEVINDEDGNPKMDVRYEVYVVDVCQDGAKEFLGITDKFDAVSRPSDSLKVASKIPGANTKKPASGQKESVHPIEEIRAWASGDGKVWCLNNDIKLPLVGRTPNKVLARFYEIYPEKNVSGWAA